jgi:hypothetical protein
LILAFKNATRAAALAANPLEKLFSLEIARVTGGPFSHVEGWLDGPITAARCFSSREPGGTQFATIDLSDGTLWTMVDIDGPPGLGIGGPGPGDFAWGQGRENRRYNFIGIMAIEFGGAITSPHDDFCSQCCFEFLQDRRGMFPKWARTDWIAPSGFGRDGKRFGLHELVTGTQKLPASREVRLWQDDRRGRSG